MGTSHSLPPPPPPQPLHQSSFPELDINTLVKLMPLINKVKDAVSKKGIEGAINVLQTELLNLQNLNLPSSSFGKRRKSKNKKSKKIRKSRKTRKSRK